ncbi:FtsB family cell division protein [Kytococcus sp. Marseille-QA3725]
MAPGTPRSSRRATGSARGGAQVALVRATPWRAVMLLGAVLLAAWIAVPPFTGWWTQRAEIQDVRQEAEAEKARTHELESERAKLRDDEHVQELARERLDYAEPGEKRYHVITRGEEAGSEADQEVAGEDRAWYETLWGSVEQTAAGVPQEPTREPDEEPVPVPEGDSTEAPVEEVEQPVPDGVPELITEDGFDPSDIPSEDLEDGEEKPTAEGEE